MNYLTVRVDTDLRTEFDKFCNARSLTSSQVIKLFILYYIRTKDSSVCFVMDTGSPDNKSGKTDVISIWLSVEHRKQFADTAVPNMSALVRGYMRHCVKYGIPNQILSYQNTSAVNRDILQEQIAVIFDIEQPLSEGAVDEVTAKQFADRLSTVRNRLGDVMDNI